MDGEQRKPTGKRELTYRVGWKTGRLEIGENGQVTSAGSTLEKKQRQRLLKNVVWRRLPVLPASALAVVLYALPVVLFGLTWWLTYLLSSVS